MRPRPHDLRVPRQALRYVALQRTGYEIYPNRNRLLRFLLKVPLLRYDHIARIESSVFGCRLEHLFVEDVAKDYESLKGHLPKSASSILDIGCGVAAIDVFLARHYGARGNPVSLYLIDRSEIDRNVRYGFHPRTSFYNSLHVTRTLLSENGVSPASIHTQEVDPANSIAFPVAFDVILSLLSWGFHYPVPAYLHQAYEHLKPGGRLFIDVRRGTGGEAALHEKFTGRVEVVAREPKFDRLAAMRS